MNPLADILREYLAHYPAFRSWPLGAPDSRTRREQDLLIALEERAKTALEKDGK